MLDHQQTSLRERLRLETADDHARVDRLFGMLDLTEPGDLARFFAAHHAGFSALLCGFPREAGIVTKDQLSRMVAALGADLDTLSARAPAVPEVRVGHEAMDHIVLGSRLGTAVLRKIWQKSSEPLVRRASRYFSLHGHAPAWRQHTAALTAQSPSGPDADRIVAETRRLYDLFESAYHASK